MEQMKPFRTQSSFSKQFSEVQPTENAGQNLLRVKVSSAKRDKRNSRENESAMGCYRAQQCMTEL